VGALKLWDIKVADKFSIFSIRVFIRVFEFVVIRDRAIQDHKKVEPKPAFCFVF
jgi:hypothetical protein